MKNKFYLKKPIFYISFVLAIALSLITILLGVLKLEKVFEDKIFEVSTSDIISIFENNAKNISKTISDFDNPVDKLIANETIRNNLELSISKIITKNIKYAYLVYRDKKGTFRFLVDASPNDKAFLNQKFDAESVEWINIYKNKKPIFIKNSIINEISITYLIPIIKDKKVEFIFAVDFSVEKVKEINKIIKWLKVSISAFILILLFFLIIFVLQTIRFINIKRSAFIDKLTNVYNRNYLLESQEFINLENFIIAAIDIDHFKKVNDTYGHIAGDKVLRQVANILSECSRAKEDIVVRYGGEEFILLVNIKRKEAQYSLNLLDRISRSIQDSKFYISDTETINITVSIGVNLHPNRSRKFTEAFKYADMALYEAKTKGRNRIEIYKEEKRRNNNHLSINEIKDAIEEKRVICFYQKIVDTKTQNSSHYEALLRIRDKDGSIITPNRILPVIKGTFILRNISKEILDITYNKLRKNQNVTINVNLNPQDIVNESIIEILQEYAKKKGIAPRLGLEVIETEEIASYDKAKENLLMLKDLGYKIYIDDFGSGYSNFIYLTQIQTDFIKIDGEMIKNINNDETTYLVVKSIVNFAKEAKIKTIAEFVSDKNIYNTIKELDIDYAQGYFFAKPEEDL